ncbi:MAG: 30S ribosomal protein S8 [bacterium]|nr:30S ribosomal protein S8 [bacterium]
MVTDPIADLLTRIRNSSAARAAKVTAPSSKVKLSLLEVLKSEGYIEAFTERSSDGEVKKVVDITLRYLHDGSPVIRELNRLSRPGKRRYEGTEDLPWFRGGLGTIILSTSQGMMCAREAREKGIGGELICSVF